MIFLPFIFQFLQKCLFYFQIVYDKNVDIKFSAHDVFLE